MFLRLVPTYLMRAAVISAGSIAVGVPVASYAKQSNAPFQTTFEGNQVGESWRASHNWRKGGEEACIWSRVRSEVGGGSARVTTGIAPDGRTITCGEVRSLRSFGYGLFETEFTAPSVSGVVSSWTLYVAQREDQPYGEIGLFLPGTDKRVRMNHSESTYEGDEAYVELGPHTTKRTYSILWEQGRITWFVDGKLIGFKQSEAVPDRPMSVFFSTWTSGADTSWLGALDTDRLPATMKVDRFEFTPLSEACGVRPAFCSASQERSAALPVIE